MVTVPLAKRDIHFLRGLLKKTRIHGIGIKFEAPKPMDASDFHRAVRFGDIDQAGTTRFSCKEASINLSRPLTHKESSRLLDAWDQVNVCKAKNGILVSGPTPSGQLWLVFKGTGRRYSPRSIDNTALIYRIGYKP